MTSDPPRSTVESGENERDEEPQDSINLSSPAAPATDLSENALFPVVGIAASAGGLEAFTELLSHLPADTGMAFVLIQHLSPDHASLLTEILARATTMPVREVKDGMMVEPNQVYVIPPNTKMILLEGLLQLSPREKVFGKYMPGDAFFTSLASDRGHQAIGVVLSGSDGDGSLGLTAIKEAGGVTFAQCENTAKFDSMPNSAIATGNVDFVLPPVKIAEELVNLSRNMMLACRLPLISAAELIAPQAALAIIFGLLQSSTGVNFSQYKPKTLDRRIQRRMLLCKSKQLAEYAVYLQTHPAEVHALYEEILIHVTSFFRDPEAFELLKTKVFHTISQNKSAEFPIRIWVTGCSTGEEVYSIAICLLEFLAQQVIRPPIQIFATDISELAIDKARVGIYGENQMVEVSPERRRRFFHTVEGGYQISKAVRELCVFARQDLGRDPPFSKVDLISCRNVLIYLNSTLQKRIMSILHYSLNPMGFLLLGASESTGQNSDLFSLIDKKHRIYSKKLSATQQTFSFTPSRYSAIKVSDRINATLANRQPVAAPVEEFELQKTVDQLIVDHYAPVGVVVNDKMQVLQLRGDIDRYLKLVAGVANFNLFNLVRSGLLPELRAAIYQAQRDNLPIKKHGLRLEKSRTLPNTPGKQSKIVNLQVIPFKARNAEEYCFLVLFEDTTAIVKSILPTEAANPQEDLEQENMQLRQEIAAAIQEKTTMQEYIQEVIQEFENSHQDLKVANEEILSSNEELQSTNEELETAKEEIQSTNEELSTTNEELRRRNGELDQVNNDLTNFLASTQVPILVLTSDLRIRRFTPMAQQLFNLISTDVGRPLSDIRTNLNIPDLEQLILEVLEILSVKELEVQTQAGYWYMLRIRPYRTTENQIDGVVLVLLDIDALKRSAVDIEAARNYAEAIVTTVQMPLVVLESDFRVNTANRSFCETFQVSPQETMQSLLFELGNGQWNIPGLRSLLEDVFAHGRILQNFHVKHQFEQIGQKTMLLNALKIIAAGDIQRILLSIEDITERQQFEVERSRLLAKEQLARYEAETANRAKDDFLSNLSHELRNPLTAVIGWAQFLRAHKSDEATMARGLEVIYRCAKAQSQLIEDMLDLSRIANGKLYLNPRQFDLSSVVVAAIEAVQLAAEAKSIQIVSELAPVTILGDVDRLQQVLWNLLSNAIKFTPADGRVEITLKPVQIDNKMQIAEVRVSDNGQGIWPELLPYVFDRFRQGDSSTTKTSQGLGLGLSIVRHIIELHGGKVRAESLGEGQGTTIIMQLPLSPLSAAMVPPIKPVVDPLTLASQEVTSLAGLSILVVDDDIDILNLLQYILRNAGAEVVIVTSAKAAIAALTESPGKFDALLADIGMPEEDGFALIHQVRALDAALGGQIPAAAITAFAGDREQQLAINAGFQRHLAKPIDPAQLIWLVTNLTRGKQFTNE